MFREVYFHCVSSRPACTLHLPLLVSHTMPSQSRQNRSLGRASEWQLFEDGILRAWARKIPCNPAMLPCTGNITSLQYFGPQASRSLRQAGCTPACPVGRTLQASAPPSRRVRRRAQWPKVNLYCDDSLSLTGQHRVRNSSAWLTAFRPLAVASHPDSPSPCGCPPNFATARWPSRANIAPRRLRLASRACRPACRRFAFPFTRHAFAIKTHRRDGSSALAGQHRVAFRCRRLVI